MMKTLVLTLTICFTPLVAKEQQTQSQTPSNLRKVSNAIHDLSYTELALMFGMVQLPSLVSTHYSNTKYYVQRMIREFRYSYNPNGWPIVKSNFKDTVHYTARWVAVCAAAAFVLKKANGCVRKWADINDESNKTTVEEEIV